MKGRTTNDQVKYIIYINFYHKLKFQGIGSKGSKGSSVKKLFIIGVMPELRESYANVKLMLSNLNLDDLKYTISADLKMCKFSNIIKFI